MKFFAAALGMSLLAASPAFAAGTKTAVLAGGCFWSMEKDLDHLGGVLKTTSGFSGGTVPSPTY